MLNKLFLLQTGLLIITQFAVAQQKPFSISGTIEGKKDGWVYLAYRSGNTDSSQIQDGKFSFSGKLTGPAQASVMMDRKGRSFDKYTSLYLIPGKMQLSLDYKNFTENAKLKGSSVQEEADALEKMKAPVMEKLKPFREAYDKANNAYIEAKKANKDEATLEKLKDEATKAKDAMDPYFDQISDIDKTFMDKHPRSFVTASMMRYRISGMKLKEAEERYNKLPDEIKNTDLGKSLKEEVENTRMGSPGATAFVFASQELRGQQLSLGDYKGKYVMLDFWASWCVPCRKGNPHLLSLYSKYKDKGFEIIGVSDDDGNPDAWKKAVEKDGIGVWKHVLRGLKRVDGPAYYDKSESISDRYGIHTLPTKILMDPNGIILGRYGGGGEDDEAMDKKLSEIFGG